MSRRCASGFSSTWVTASLHKQACKLRSRKSNTGFRGAAPIIYVSRSHGHWIMEVTTNKLSREKTTVISLTDTGLSKSPHLVQSNCKTNGFCLRPVSTQRSRFRLFGNFWARIGVDSDMQHSLLQLDQTFTLEAKTYKITPTAVVIPECFDQALLVDCETQLSNIQRRSSVAPPSLVRRPFLHRNVTSPFISVHCHLDWD